MTFPPELRVAVIGAGMSGLAMGMRLKDAGVEFTIFEKADEVGGTWRDNRYPGLTIDVPSPIYTYGSERHPGWRRWMPEGREILDYHRDVADRRGLRQHIRFGTEITAAEWAGDRWRVHTRDGGEEAFDVLVCATGFLHHPREPQIPGLEDFDGTCVHSARWDDAIGVHGRRVGVIGSGSTGTQLTTALARVASHLTLFQRTPQWVYPAPNFTIPRSVRRLFARRPKTMDTIAGAIDVFGDWLVGGAARRAGGRRRFIATLAKAHLATVRDPELRARLTPPDASLCRRPVFSNGFYRAVQRRNVSVVSDPIAHATASGIVTADGVHHELDVLIFATGFHAHNYMRPMKITGEGGRTLDEAWAQGPHGYRTVALSGFPNLFMLLGPHSPLVSIPLHVSAELQADYVMQMLEVLADPEVVSVAPTQDATERWLQDVRAGMPGTVWAAGCASWYVGAGETPVLWPYDRYRWRALLQTPELRDYEIR